MGDATHNALDDVTLKIEKGEFIAIMGPSGCGKTTLLNVIGLLDRVDDGDYFLDGKSIERLSAKQQARVRSQQIGIVFQSFNLINRLTVLENVALPLTYKGVRRTKRLMRASDVLKTFHLSEREYYMPWQLVAIARALVNEPSIILADEPTGNLDSRSSHVIMEELSDLHKKGNTIIMVTHNPNLTSYASRVINMLDGKIASDTKIKVDTHDADTVTKIPLNRKLQQAKVDAIPATKRAKKPAKAKTSKATKPSKKKGAKK